MAEPSNGCASRVAHAASPSRRHCIRATPTVLPTKQCPLQIFPVALDAAMQRTRSLTPRESRSYQARSQKSSDRVRSALIGLGLEFALLGYSHGFRSAAAPTPRSSTWIFRWKVERNGLQDSFPSFFLIFCIFRSNPSLTICSWARQACQFDALYQFFLLFISTCALRLCLSLTFGVLLPVSVNFVMQEFFFLKKYYTVIWAVSVGHLGCWWLSMEPPSVRAISFSCARTTAAANGPCGWNPVKS